MCEKAESWGLTLLPEEAHRRRLGLVTSGWPCSLMGSQQALLPGSSENSCCLRMNPHSIRPALNLLLVTIGDPGLLCQHVYSIGFSQNDIASLHWATPPLVLYYELETIVSTLEITCRYKLQRPTLFFCLLTCLSFPRLITSELIHFGKRTHF